MSGHDDHLGAIADRPTLPDATGFSGGAPVRYIAVYRSDLPLGHPDRDPDSYLGICVGLFGDLDDALAEAKVQLKDGYDVNLDHGEMSQAEWDALEEVPDDFHPHEGSREGK